MGFCQVSQKVCLSTSKNVMIFLELGTNVMISSHCHIIFLGLACSKSEFQTWREIQKYPRAKYLSFFSVLAFFIFEDPTKSLD